MKSPFRSPIMLIVLIALLSSVSAASAHHAPRLFDNRHGDHGGSYNNGKNIFFWMPDEKRFDTLKVCLWKRGSDDRQCKRFEIRRVNAASYQPWGIEIETDRHFRVTSGGWNLRFFHAGKAMSPRLGFHRD